MVCWLVVYYYPSEKYEFVKWDDDIPNIWKNKKCFKPPTRWYDLMGLWFTMVYYGFIWFIYRGIMMVLLLFKNWVFYGL